MSRLRMRVEFVSAAFINGLHYRRYSQITANLVIMTS